MFVNYPFNKHFNRACYLEPSTAPFVVVRVRSLEGAAETRFQQEMSSQNKAG